MMRGTLISCTGPLTPPARAQGQSANNSGGMLVYLGVNDEVHDGGFLSLTAQLRSRHAVTMGGWSLRHLRFPDSNVAGQQTAAISHALAMRPQGVIAPTGAAATALMRADKHMPLVFASFSDPARMGLFATGSRRNRAATGISLFDNLHAKRLELLHDAFPGVARLGVLADRGWADYPAYRTQIDTQSGAFGWSVTLHVADEASTLARLLDSHEFRRMDAWYVPATYLSYRFEQPIIQALARWRRPAVHCTVAEVQQGALLAYAQDHGFVYEAMAELVARLCQGEDPALIPIERPRRFILALRPRTEPAELRLPPALVRRADLVL